jgi:type 1 glutamine amidotransferase
MRKPLATLIGSVLLATTLLVPAAAAKIKVLVITGDDVGPHPWREVSQATRQVLMDAGKFEVKVCEDPGVLESAASLKRYDVIYLAMYNDKTPTLTDAAKQNLLAFVKEGKGFVASHLSSASFKEWDEFKKLCGRNWVMGKSGHGPRSVFKCKIADQNHPITQGLEGFETDDELYAKMQGDTPIQALVTADSDWSKQTEPLAFVLSYGQGRVFHHTFGHDGKAINTPAVQKLIQRGTQWAATGKVE